MFKKTLSVVLACTFISSQLWACACGCGIFEVGTSSMFPTHPGGMVSLEYDYLHQNRNWSGDSPSSADNNDDKKVLSNFITLGYNYMFNRRWGVLAEVPVTNRYFKTTDDDTGEIISYTHSTIGDIRLSGVFTGFSDDMSSGLTFGVKLPSGDFTYPNFDPDVEIGSGSTDILLGVYHMGALTPGGAWNWFADAEGSQPILHYSGYIPGSDINAAVGTYFNRWHVGAVKIAPMAEIRGSHRWSDNGSLADAQNTGYSRVLAGPGIECDTLGFRIFTDVGFPVYQYVTGNQLGAAEYVKLNVSYHF